MRTQLRVAKVVIIAEPTKNGVKVNITAQLVTASELLRKNDQIH